MSPPAEWPYTRTLPTCLLADDSQRPFEFGVILREVGDEVGGLAVASGTAALLQVQRVEGETPLAK